MFLNKKLKLTVFVLGVLILFSKEVNTNSAIENQLGGYYISTSLEIKEKQSSEFSDFLVLYFQLIHPSPIRNAFNGDTLGKAI